MNVALIWKSITVAMGAYVGVIRLWFIKHQADFAALVKLLEEQYADGTWTIEEKEAFKNEAIHRLVLVGLPWYIPQWLALKLINGFINKIISKARTMKGDLVAIVPPDAPAAK
jgi:hypothetical protein